MSPNFRLNKGVRVANVKGIAVIKNIQALPIVSGTITPAKQYKTVAISQIIQTVKKDKKILLLKIFLSLILSAFGLEISSSIVILNKSAICLITIKSGKDSPLSHLETALSE